MKKLLPLLAAVFLSALSAHAQDYAWVKSISASGVEIGSRISTSDASGNVYITGFFDGTVDFDPGAGNYPLTSAGAYDIFVVKLDPAGNFVWASAIGGSGYEAPNGIAVDASGYPFITGYFASSSCDFDPGPGTQFLANGGGSNNIFVCKLDQSGGYAWAVQMGTTSYDDAAYALTLDASSNVYVTGYFEGTVDFDPGAGNGYLISDGTGKDVFVVKLDAFGSFVWVKQLGGAGNEIGTSIAVDPAGSVLIAGYFNGTVDFDPGAGTVNQSSQGNNDAFLCKLDNSGTYQWAKTFGSSGGGEQIMSVATDLAGSAYVTGYFEGATDFDPGAGSVVLSPLAARNGFISKFNATGSLAWVTPLVGVSIIEPRGITTDNLANVYSTGNFTNTVDFDPGAGTFNLNTSNSSDQDVYIQRLDSAGNFGWAGRVGSTQQESGFGISVDANYNIYTTGEYQLTVDFDPGTGIANQVAAGGSGDCFVLKLDQCNPQVNAGTDVLLCDGVSTMLTATGTAGNYTWNPGAYSGTSYLINPTTTTTYTLTGSNISACSVTDEVLVTVNPLPAVPNLGPDIDSCANAMTIGVTDDGVSSYIWTSNPAFYNSTAPQTPITQQSSMPVDYHLTIVDAITGCGNSDTITVTLKETPNAELGNNISACSNVSPTVNVGVSSETNVTYDWTSNPPGMSSTSSMIGIGPATPTWFILEALNTVSGCVVKDSVNVVINPSPSLTLIAPFTNYACFGDSVQLANYLTASGGTPPYFIDWWYGPGHVYGVNPTYTVTASWTFSVSIVDANSCSQGATTSFQLFNSGNNTDLVGHVTTPLPADVDNGLVYAFRYQPGAAGLDTIATAPLDANGEYNFVALENDQYLIKAIADEVAFPLLVPTYYGNAFQWDSSLVVTHGCTQIDTADIEMLELPPPGGPGVVSGYVIEGDSFGIGARFNGYLGPIYPCVPGGPLKGIDVKLGKNPGGGIQARVVTDSTGKYEFTNLPLLGYRIYVDIPNLPMDSTREIILDAINNISLQNNYFADSASIYINPDTIVPVGIYASNKLYENNFTIYPNPAKDILFVHYELNKAGDLTVELTNALGQTIKADAFKDLPSGEFRHRIDVPSLQLKAGVYFISIVNDSRKYAQRLVVIE